jgi:hypothetical protein
LGVPAGDGDPVVLVLGGASLSSSPASGRRK